MKNKNQVNIFKEIPTGKVGWQSPSNIALVKYWGKQSGQIPSNASLSFTLSESFTETIVEYSPKINQEFKLEFFLDDEANEKFANKTFSFFKRLINSFPFIEQLDFKVYSKNTFPHSAGIASSASGMSALALCLCEIERKYFDEFSSDEKFFRRASYFARLGSGSACRSLYGGLVSWGEIEGNRHSSNKFGHQLINNVDEIFKDFHDSILIVDAGQKKVSSSLGHSLMNSNPFSQARFNQAATNIQRLLEVLKSEDLEEFIQIVETEALTLHSMMMTSSPNFLLMKPNTISIIEKIWEFRKETGIPVCFTLDAGPNIHLLYPHKYQNEVKSFINSKLQEFTFNNTVIHDKVGLGPVKLDL